MSDIVLNPDGTSIWTDAREKLEAVKKALLPHLQRIKTKWEHNETEQYPRKLEFNPFLSQTLVLNFRKYPKIPSNYAVEIDTETLKEYINCYFDLVEYILDFYPEFVSTKSLFIMWCGVDSYAYSQWLISPNPDILSEIQFVETHLEEITVLSAQTGRLKEKSSEIRLKSNGIGHNLNLKTAEETTQTINLVSFDKESVLRKLENLGVRMLNDKKSRN